MKKKIQKSFFWNLTSISTLFVVANIGLYTLNRSANNNSNFLQNNPTSTFRTKQQKQTTGISDSTDVLNFTYDSEHQAYTVTGFKETDQLLPNYTLIIPKTYNDGRNGEHRVTEIAKYAFASYANSNPKTGSDKITRIDFGNIEKVNEYAFNSCSNLENVTFSENLILLASGCFSQCPQLKCLTIPKNKNNIKQEIRDIFDVSKAFFDKKWSLFSKKIIFLCNSNTDIDFYIFNFASWRDGHAVFLTPQFYFLDSDLVKKLINGGVPLSGLLDGKSNVSHFSKITTAGNDHEFLVHKNDGDDNKLIGLNTSAKDKTELTIPAEINKIDGNSFQERSEQLKCISFPKGTDIISIDQNAFAGVPDTTRYRVNVNDPNSRTYNVLKRVLGDSAIRKLSIYRDDGDFIMQGFSTYTEPNELVNLTEEAKSKNELFIPKYINKIGGDAFKNCLPNLKSITFERGINLIDIDKNVFESVPKTATFYASDRTLANNLRDVYNIESERIYYPTGIGSFVTYQSFSNEHLELAGLTEDGKKLTNLTIPRNIIGIKKNTFVEHSDELNSITFEDGSKISNIADDVFKNIPASTLYYVNDEGLAQTLLERNDIRKENIYTLPKNGTSFIRAKEWLNQKRSILGLTENGRKESTLTIADTDRIQTNALSDSSPNLKRIIFQGDNIGFDPNALKGVNEHTVYYVDSNNSECATINGLKQQGKVDATKIYLQKENEQDISVRSRLDHKSKTLVGLSPNGLVKNELTIPSDVNRIDSEAFKNVTNPINKITFSQNIKLNHIGNDAFKNEMLKNTQYIVNSTDVTTTKLLKQNGVNDNQIILKDDQYNISLSGILTEIKVGNNSQVKNLISLSIPKKINGIDVTGIGPNAFSHCLNVAQIEFDNGIILDKSKIDPNAFSKFNTSKTFLYVYNNANASTLSEVSSLTIGIANGNFFNEYHNQNKLIGLTSSGRNETKLEVSSNITDLKRYAFLGCSSKLKEIYIDGNDINLDDGIFDSVLRSVLGKVQFYVVNDDIKYRLTKKHIPAKNIRLFVPKTKNSYAAIGIAVGSILLAILLLGLGIGIPMRKQHKVNILQAKLNGKRIDKLSAANAVAFKKVVEATGNISRQINKLTDKMSLLNSVVGKVTKPSDPSKPSIKK